MEWWERKPCGTEAAARWHRRHGEVPLHEICARAETLATQLRREQRKKREAEQSEPVAA